MNTKNLIDRLLLYTDNTLSTDAGTTVRRVKHLEWAQEVWDEVWHYAEWPFSYTTTGSPLTIPVSQGYVALPAGFSTFGDRGTAYLSTDYGTPMTEVSPQLIQRAQRSTGSTANPTEFCVYMADDGLQRFQVPTNSEALTVYIYYKKIPPTLVDIDHATTSMLQHIPAAYHYSVLLAGCKEKAARSKGDARASSEWAGVYQSALAKMVQKELSNRYKSSIHRLGRATVGMW